MNWLGKMVQQYVHKDDVVLDLGCGIMQATTGILDGEKSLKCKTILGVELQEKYLDRVKLYYPTIHSDVRVTQLFVDESYDVVLCTDVLEHLKHEDATFLLHEMKRISRKYVIIYTPKVFDENGDNMPNAWGMGENKLQKHQCLVAESLLHKLGFKTSITEIDGNVFGVYEK